MFDSFIKKASIASNRMHWDSLDAVERLNNTNLQKILLKTQTLNISLQRTKLIQDVRTV